jgi:hypothetical protein
MMNIKILKMALAGLVLGVSGFANAGVIIQAESISTSTRPFSVDYLPEYAIDQSGLSKSYSSGIDDFDAYLAFNPTHVNYTPTGYLTQKSIPYGYLDMSLGGPFNVSALALWNAGEYVGVDRFSLYASSDSSFLDTTFIGSFWTDEPSGNAEVFDFAPITTRYIRFEILLNNSGGGFSTGINEIAFRHEVTPVPEPSAFAIFALGLMGLASRRLMK